MLGSFRFSTERKGEMKTPREFAEAASKVLGDGFKGISSAELLIPFFIQALAERGRKMSIEYISGPPTEPGEYFVILENEDKIRMDVGNLDFGKLYFESEENGRQFNEKEIAFHVGPLVMPEKPKTEHRQWFYCAKTGKQYWGTIQKDVEVLIHESEKEELHQYGMDAD